MVRGEETKLRWRREPQYKVPRALRPCFPRPLFVYQVDVTPLRPFAEPGNLFPGFSSGSETNVGESDWWTPLQSGHRRRCKTSGAAGNEGQSPSGAAAGAPPIPFREPRPCCPRRHFCDPGQCVPLCCRESKPTGASRIGGRRFTLVNEEWTERRGWQETEYEAPRVIRLRFPRPPRMRQGNVCFVVSRDRNRRGRVDWAGIASMWSRKRGRNKTPGITFRYRDAMRSFSAR